MRKRILSGFLFGLAIGGLSFLSTRQWIFGLSFGVLAFACCVFVYLPILSKRKVQRERGHECYLFIHRFLITLSVTNSLEKSFESGSEGMGADFVRLNAGINALSARAKTEYLHSYFLSDLYKMFLSLLDLYLDRGGDVLRLASELMQEIGRAHA